MFLALAIFDPIGASVCWTRDWTLSARIDWSPGSVSTTATRGTFMRLSSQKGRISAPAPAPEVWGPRIRGRLRWPVRRKLKLSRDT